MAYLRSQKSTMNRVRLYYLKRREIIWLGMMTQSRNFLIRNNGSLGLYQKDVKGQKKVPKMLFVFLRKKIDITVEYEIRPRTMLFTVYLSFFLWRHGTKYWTWWRCEKHFVQFIFNVIFSFWIVVLCSYIESPKILQIANFEILLETN